MAKYKYVRVPSLLESIWRGIITSLVIWLIAPAILYL